MQQVGWQEFIALVAPEPVEPDAEEGERGARAREWYEGILDARRGFLAQIKLLARERGARGLVWFVNQDVSSSEYGKASVVAFGPRFEYKTAEECEGRWLYDVPSQRQYAKVWVDVSDKSIIV